MGFLDLFVQSAPKVESADVEAGLAPFNISDSLLNVYATTATRQKAMSIPAVARARNIICSSVASLPLEQYNKLTGAHIEPPRVINQPDPRVPGSSIYAWVAEDLLFLGTSFGQIMELYSDGRVSAWTRLDPARVTTLYNNDQTQIIGYQVNGKTAPLSGVGSVFQFFGMDEGLLARAGATIRAAAALERAAENFAAEPVPTMVLKSNGTNLTSERINKLLSSWNSSRRNRATAFLNADVELQALGFDPAKLQLNEARQYLATELARAVGLPAYFLSAEPNSMTYSNAINERKALVDFSLRPILTIIEQTLSMPMFATSTTETRYDLDDFLRGDPLVRAQTYEILNRIGAMSVEQIQQEEDLIR